MLIGEYTHSLDVKKRLSLPAKFRKEIGKKIVVTHGLDTCLFLYPLKTWVEVSERLAGLSTGRSDTRSFSRFILAGAVEVDVDAMGRILVPDFLKEFAGLAGRVVITGVHNRIELWDEKAWSVYKKRVREQADALAEKLGEIGVL